LDPVTQTALGAAVGACFRTRLGGKAIVIGALCGFSPDLDVLIPGDSFSSLVHHRGFTHALPVLTAISPAVGWLALRWSRTGTLVVWTHLAFWALVTHPLLDWCTTYGTQLWLPLTNARYSNDAVAVIDPVGTLPLLIAVAINLRSDWTAARQAAWSTAMLALFGLFLLVGYVAAESAKQYAARQLDREGIAVAEIRAPATMFNVVLRRVVARTNDGRLLVGHVSALVPRPIEFAEAPWLDEPLRRELLTTREGRIFVWFADDLLAVHREPVPGGEMITLSDQRYGLISRPLASPFRIRAVREDTGSFSNWQRVGRDMGDVGQELRWLARGVFRGEVPTPEA
jgi:inner membrane protein